MNGPRHGHRLEYVHEILEYVVDIDAISCPTFVSYG